MPLDRIVTRRSMLKASAAFSAPMMVPRSLLAGGGATSPSEKIAIALIGCGKMANDYHLSELLKFDDVRIVAVCDVDTNRRQHAKRRVDLAYDNKDCSEYADFRRVIERDGIDAVCIATPDHWHATPAIEACKAGKEVYCEKPLTLTIAEAERCLEAARKYNRVFQTGSQQRSNVFGPFREAVEFVRSGRLGRLQRVTVGVGGPSVPCGLPEEVLEPGLDWNLWLGQAPLRPYNSILSPRGVHNHFPGWRNYIEYSGGAHSDIGAHHYDIAQWAMGRDASGPMRIVPPKNPQDTSGVRFIYDDGVEMIHGGPSGCVFYGTNGQLHVDRGHLSSMPASIIGDPLSEGEVHLFRSPGHHRNWLNCIRSRERPVADVEVGARTVTIIHLGNLAYHLRETLFWDPATWSFDQESKNAWKDRERRDPWQLPTV
jgi:predicted dehydrogenase